MNTAITFRPAAAAALDPELFEAPTDAELASDDTFTAWCDAHRDAWVAETEGDELPY